MRCPACRDTMVVLEYAHVEIDFCPACKGVWLDSGELELLFGDEKSCQAFLREGDSAANREKTRRRCPICGKKMAKGVTAGDNPVTYDRCGQGDGLWFDEGELAQVLEHGHSRDSKGELTGFLREIFSEKAKRVGKT